jgi:hypothetical protein
MNNEPNNDNADSAIAGGGGIGDWLENQPDECWWVRHREDIVDVATVVVPLVVVIISSVVALWLW